MAIDNFIANNYLTGIITGLITILAHYLIKKCHLRLKTRQTRKFWKPVINERISIVLTEYDCMGNDISAKTAISAGGRFLVSRGNAMALSNLLEYLPDKVTNRSKISVIGDKSSNADYEHLIVIGSWANNFFAKIVFENIKEKLDIPFEVIHDKETGKISFRNIKEGNCYTPCDGNQGNDYALIIRAKYRSLPDRYAYILAGAHMHGAQAASMAVTNHEILKHVTYCSKGSSDILFLIRTSVINDNPSAPEIEFDHNKAIHKLNMNKKQYWKK